MKKFIFLLLALSLLLFSEDFIGKRVGESNIFMGGYFSIEYFYENGKKVLDFDELALIGYGEFERSDFLTELELSHSYKKIEGGGEEIDKKIHIERLFFRFYFENDDVIKIGKFNSKIGFWNKMPINVLRPTTSSPYLVEKIFPKFTTGIEYTKMIDKFFFRTFSLTIQNNRDLDGNYNNFSISKHYSFCFDFEKENTSVRMGGGYFKTDLKQNRYYFMAFKNSSENIDLSAEYAIRITDEQIYLHDIYLQSVYYFPQNIELIFRAERYDHERLSFRENRYLMGVAYRPLINIALKGEFEVRSKLKNRVLFSLSMMF